MEAHACMHSSHHTVWQTCSHAPRANITTLSIWSSSMLWTLMM